VTGILVTSEKRERWPQIQDRYFHDTFTTAPMDMGKVGEALAQIYDSAGFAPAPVRLVDGYTNQRKKAETFFAWETIEKLRDQRMTRAYNRVNKQLNKWERDALFSNWRDGYTRRFTRATGFFLNGDFYDSWTQWNHFRGSAFGGSFEIPRLAFYRYLREEFDMVKETSPLDPYFTLAEHGWLWVPQIEEVIMYERPSSIMLSLGGAVHCDSGPAVTWPDGTELYAFNGHRVPSWIIMEPDKITPKKIMSEQNAETRRVMITLFGFERLIKDLDAIVVDVDINPEIGTLYKFWDIDGVQVAFVVVRNGTQEPDGSYRTFALRVRPAFVTALRAVRSTYPTLSGLSDEEYRALTRT